MVFLSVCVALYQYVPRDDGELAIKEGELVYILEKSAEDDWWKATKKASGGERDDPIGLIPQTYVEEAQPTHHAKALYDYTRQTDEELSFSEDAALTVFDTTDPDWTLVGLKGEYGFVPTNYIEITGDIGSQSPASEHTQHAAASRQPMTPESPVDSPVESPQSPAAALARVMRARAPSASQTRKEAPPPQPARPQYTPQASDEESDAPAPSLPQRRDTLPLSPPPAQSPQPRHIPEAPGVMASPPYLRSPNAGNQSPSSPGGFHLYNINEMVSALGKKKKLPTTLGINLATGNIMIAPEKSRDGPQQEWTAEKLTNYSIEGKHVFIDLVKPSKSIHFHAGAKDTAMEIVSALGELAGAARAEGLREVIAAGTGAGAGQRKGHVLYDFMAQGEDEVTVAVGDDVVILDDIKSEEWWMVRRLKTGKEGVVPSSYVEVVPGIASPTVPGFSGISAGRSNVEQNRMEEERLAKDAVKPSKRSSKSERGSEVGPGVRLPKRGSSLSGPQDSNHLSLQRNKRDSRNEAKGASKPKPDSSKVRVWTDRSGSFKVEAQFIGLKDGKINLHKLNGVKIAVPVSKMAVEDLEYVEQQTGLSLDEDKPISSIVGKNKKLPAIKDRDAPTGAKVMRSESAGPEASSKPQPKPPEYDWFDFFLKCGVNPYQCERYAFSFNKDSMDEDILPEITAPLLRSLGLKEGDVLRVMKFLDVKYSRKGNKSKLGNVTNAEGEEEGDEEKSGGLFSGPGGTLKNNTRKGRPAPAVQTNDTVDPKAFQQKHDGDKSSTEKVSTPLASAPTPVKKNNILDGFDDDAWDVKPSKPANGPASAAHNAVSTPQQAPSPPKPQLTAGQAELSLLSTPLQPIIAHSTGAPPGPPTQQPQQPPLGFNPQQQQQAQPHPQQPVQPQQTGATPGFFANLSQQNFGGQPQPNPQQSQQPQYVSPQQTGFGQQPRQFNQPRQRPQPPQFVQSSGVLPPPPRPLSAPQNSQQNNFGPPPRLAPQLTGAPPQNFGQNQSQPQQPTLNDLSRLTLQNQQFSQPQQQFQHPQQLQPQPTGFPQQGQTFNQFGNFGPQQPPQQFGQQQSLGPQPTGFQPQPTGFQPQPTGFQPQQTGFQSQLFQNGQQSHNSPFADPRPGFQSQFSGISSPPPIPPQRTGINSFLPPALNPQPTGVNGFNRPAFGQPGPQPSFGQAAPPPPPIPQQPTLAPLQPQKTGPAPPVSFGRQEAKNLVPQPTGRRANLSQATPDNPFGF